MTVKEYVKLAKEELYRFEATWNRHDDWPKDLPEEEWREQELVSRLFD